MDYLFLAFAILLGIAGLGFVGVFIYRLLRTPEVGKGVRHFNLFFLALAGVAIIICLGLALLAEGRAADWGTVIASGLLAVTLLLLAAQGFWVGFRQMDEDGIGFLRFFQLGSSIVLCLAIAPAFFALITYASRLR